MKIGDKGIFLVNVNDAVFTYTGEIIDTDETHITFRDKYGKIWSYLRSSIISFEIK